MPDITYRETDEFRGLDGQSEPKQELLDGVFKRARFDTRFYEEVQVYEPERSKEGVEEGGKEGRFLLSAALQPQQGQEDDFDNWYREEHLKVLSECEGYVRTRRYEVRDASTLDRFVRKRYVYVPSLALPSYPYLLSFFPSFPPISSSPFLPPPLSPHHSSLYPITPFPAISIFPNAVH
jgi:hypothetical protein